MQPLGGERRRQRFRTEISIAQGPFGLIHGLQPSKAAHIVVDERGTGIHGKTHRGMGRRCFVSGPYEAAGHAQVYDQDHPFGEMRNDVFAPSVDGFECPSLQTGGEFPAWLAKDVRVKDPEAFDRLAGKRGAKSPDDGFDLW